ncbi:MAG: hypothetical protein V2I65_03595 [Paracoccaceae bacterium]|jgi:hypothetical protein|nr:hypothetical protein [Paracoccaceae bacterium]
MAYRFTAPKAAAFALACSALAGGAPACAGEPQAVELVMVEQPGCTWCARWNAEIAPIWPRTAAGDFAPLRRAQLRDMPGEMALERRVTFTPTFLIISGQGEELGRLEGYPGEDFFWPLIERLLVDTAGFAPHDGVTN